MKRIVIWGLKLSRHSHRFIHKGFADNFKKMGFETYWVEDSKKNQELLLKPSIVFGFNGASKHLLYNKSNCYVLHNIERPVALESRKILNLQVLTTDSKGVQIDNSKALYDDEARTLYQPWGIPEARENWLEPRVKLSKIESWIGSVWNNSLGQGNRAIIESYIIELSKRKIKFRRKGGTRSFSLNGVSPKKAFYFVNRSPIGSAVVGEWQFEHRYLPCRIFKNVAAGAIPSSNSDMSSVFGDVGIFNPNLGELIDRILNVSLNERCIRVKEAQNLILKYTYEASIKRIIKLLETG
jgi:hypothetical protein